MPVDAAGHVERSVVASAFVGFMVAAKMTMEEDATLEKRRTTNQGTCSSRAENVMLHTTTVGRAMHYHTLLLSLSDSLIFRARSSGSNGF